MDLRRYYDDALVQHGFEADTAQLEALDLLAMTAEGLCSPRAEPDFLQRVKQLFTRRTTYAQPVKGVYLWGDVGRGKTFLMDVFFDALPFAEKKRFHFHRLMNRVHRQLKELDNEENPVDRVAGELARTTRVLCFDEFFVSDIGDAMILARLLEGLFSRQVTLVATSNTAPSALYLDGLQRQQFLPAIDLIEQHTRVNEIGGRTDYRLRVLEQAEIYHSPLDDTAEVQLDRYFAQIAPETGTHDQAIEILGRDIQTRQRADGIVWFDFQAICNGPRSQDDYIEISRSFSTLIVSGIPRLDDEKSNETRRLIALVDELYERRVNLIVSAAVPLAILYDGSRLAHEFQRTMSRLIEMQSTDYLAAAHVP
jgi:cell division protein ZapE